jgi:hypothetical protein
MVVSPDSRRFWPRVKQRLFHPLDQRRPDRRLLARLANTLDAPARCDHQLALCSSAAGAAERLGYDEVLLGPICDAEESLCAGLSSLGARPVHTYQVFEKEF